MENQKNIDLATKKISNSNVEELVNELNLSGSDEGSCRNCMYPICECQSINGNICKEKSSKSISETDISQLLSPINKTVKVSTVTNPKLSNRTKKNRNLAFPLNYFFDERELNQPTDYFFTILDEDMDYVEDLGNWDEPSFLFDLFTYEVVDELNERTNTSHYPVLTVEEHSPNNNFFKETKITTKYYRDGGEAVDLNALVNKRLVRQQMWRRYYPSSFMNPTGQLSGTLTITLSTYQKGIFSIEHRYEKFKDHNFTISLNNSVFPRVSLQMGDKEVDYIKTTLQMRPDFNPLSYLPGLSDLRTLCNSVQEDVLPQVEDSANTLHTLLSNITERLKKENVPELKAEAESFVTRIIENVGIKMTKGALKATSFALFASALMDYCNNWTAHAGSFLILSIVVLLIIWADELSMILTGIVSLLGKTKLSRGVKVQSGSAFDAIGTGLVSLLVGLSIKNEKPGRIPDNILQKLGSFDRTKKAVADFFQFFIEIICMIADKVHLGQYVPTNFRYAYIKEEDIKDLSSKIDSMVSDLNQNSLILSHENYEVLLSYDRGLENHLLELPRIPQNNGLITILTDQRKNVKMLMKKFEERFVRNIRQEPVCVMLRGSPGTLKSSALQHLCYAAVINSVSSDQLEHAKKDPAYYMYNRTPEQQFWDGFRSGCSIVTYIDDFGQVRDIAGTPDAEAMSVIRMVNSLEAQLHVAELGGKGNVRFDSKYVIMTTNAVSFKFESVISSLAVCRRFDMTYTVVPRLEYIKDEDKGKDLMNRSIDMNKLPMGELDVTSVHPRFLEFHEFSYVTGKHSGNVLSYEEVEARMLAKERVKNKWFVQNELELRKTADRHIAIREKRANSDTSTEVDSESSSIKEEDEVDVEMLDMRAINDAIYVIEKLEDQNLEILPSVPETLEKELYYKLPKNSGVKKYVDECLDLMSSNPYFYIYDKAILLTLLCNNNVHDFLTAIKQKCERFKIRLLLKTRLDYPKGLPVIKGKLMTFVDKISSWFATAFDSCFTKVMSYFRDFVAWTKEGNNLYILLGGITTISLLIGSVCGWIGLRKTVEEEETIQPDPTVEVVLEKGDYHLRSRQTFKVVQKLETATGEQYVPVSTQMGSVKDKSGYDQVISKLHTNMYTLNRLKEDGPVRVGYVTFLEGRICIMNYHYILHYRKQLSQKLIDPRCMFELTRATKGDSGLRCYKFAIEEFLSLFKTNEELAKEDLCFAYIDKVSPHTSIVKLFPTKEEQIKSKADFGMLLSKCGREVKQVSFIVKTGSNIVDRELSVPYHNTYSYLGYTSPGDCGSWLELLDRTSRAKLFGFHLAGDTETGIGYAIPVNQETIEIGLNLCGNRMRYDWPMEVQTQMGEQFLDKYDIISRTNLPNATVGRTNIVRTPVFGAWGKATTIPCKLTKFVGEDGNLIDPYSKNIIKFCKPDIFIPKSVMSCMGDSMYDFLKKKSSPFTSRILSFEEAVAGIPDDDFYSGINVATSPGYPLNMDKSNREPGKKKWFTVNEDGSYDLSKDTCKELKTEVELVISKLENGERTQFIFADCLKDETRPWEKVMEGKTRIFSSCPLVYFIIVRMYFGAYQSWYMRNHTENGSALGVNPYSQMWHNLAMKFKQFLENDDDIGVGAGDYSSFDGSQLTQQQNEVLRIINKIYDDEHSFIREMLWLEVTSSVHIKDDIIYQWQGSLPSGHPLTPIINCMYNHLNLRYCWYRANNNNLSSMWEFDNFVYVIVLGDDNAFSVHKSARSIFNEVTIGEFMKEIGMTYTTELKVKAEIPLRKLTDISFLKRKFRAEPLVARYVAPLDLQVVLETSYWCNKNPNIYSITQDLVQNSIDELSLHGEEVFLANITKITKGIEKRMGVNPGRTNFLICLDRVCQLEAFF